MIFNLVKPEHITPIWGEVSEMLAPAVEHAKGETTLDAVFDSLMKDECKLIIARDGGEIKACGTIFMKMFPSKKVCQVSLCGGTDMKAWCDGALTIVEKISRDAGADAVYIQGRKGWVRRLKNLGYNEYSTLVVKEL